MTHIEFPNGIVREVEIYQANGDWQALYLDGVLHSQGHDVTATLLMLLNIEIINDDAFLRGGNGGGSNNTAPTIGDIDQWKHERDLALNEAAELRIKANGLTAEASRIEHKFLTR